jgi:hypothetical protein
MSTANKDANSVSTLICPLNTDGVTIQRVYVNPTTHAMNISNGTTGTDYGFTRAIKDDNGVAVLVGVSSADFSTPVDIYADSSGNLLTKST